MRKILFTDLDGTLLKTDKTVSTFTRDFFDKWTREGNYIALSSGRDINSVLMVKDELQLDFPHVYAIGYNGGQIYDCDKKETVYKVTLDTEQVAYLYKRAREAGIYVHTYDDDYIIVPEVTKETAYYTRVIKTPVRVSENLKLNDPPCKCLMIELEDSEKFERFRQSLTDWAEENRIAILYSNPRYIEVFPAQSGKGNAVKKLTELLNIPGLVSIAAGDEENDISMIEAADIGIAMVNGTDAVKAAADIITQYSNDEDGLARCLDTDVKVQ